MRYKKNSKLKIRDLALHLACCANMDDKLISGVSFSACVVQDYLGFIVLLLLAFKVN